VQISRDAGVVEDDFDMRGLASGDSDLAKIDARFGLVIPAESPLWPRNPRGILAARKTGHSTVYDHRLGFDRC